MESPQAIVAVLAGGRGARIGGSKASVALGGRPLIAHVLAAVREAGIEAVIVAKPGAELSDLRERVVEEPAEPRHPLCGILAALEFASEWSAGCAVLALACDMPFLPSALLSRLAALDGPVVLELDGAMQPLPARCTQAQRSELREALAHERSLRSALAAVSPRILGEGELAEFGDPARLLFGVNSREDLARAEALLAGSSSGSAA
jgi:molybdopterin-guanine dinucleotide biosynthesis protein A